MKKSFNDERRNRIEGTTFSPAISTIHFLYGFLLLLPHNNNYNNSTSLVTKYRQQLMDKSRKEELYYNSNRSLCVGSSSHLLSPLLSFIGIYTSRTLFLYEDVARRRRGMAAEVELRIKPIYLSEKTLTVLGKFLYAIKLQFQERGKESSEQANERRNDMKKFWL